MKTQQEHIADYDHVGRYTQDSVNGLSDELLNKMIDFVAPKKDMKILDAMGGDGNLSVRLSRYCKERKIPLPDITILEYSRVQAEFAQASFPPGQVEVVCGDILTMKSFDGLVSLKESYYDRIMIKSAIHEIPSKDHDKLFTNLYKALKPGGILVNLGFLLDDEIQQKEVKELARVKDSLADMRAAVERRYFTTREELYERLKRVGFESASSGSAFDYRIQSHIVSEHYFDNEEQADLEYQAAHAKAIQLRRSGRIHFDADSCVLRLPGEITLATKQKGEVGSPEFFTTYPYEFMRRLRVHSDMLNKTLQHIPKRCRVLDVACGPGLLTEKLLDHQVMYTGIDISEQFIKACQHRFKDNKNMTFYHGDVHDFEMEEESFDVVALLNILNLDCVRPVDLLTKAYDALGEKGRIIVAGPTSAESFEKAEKLILQHLKDDGLDTRYTKEFTALSHANKKILSQNANYWSEEGMVELLKFIGFEKITALDNGLYNGLSYLVVADK